MQDGQNIVNDCAVYHALLKVYKGECFSNVALDDALLEADSPNFVTAFFYGVLEKDGYLQAIVDELVKTAPKPIILAMLKMGIYMAKFMNIPDYAVTNRIIDVARKNHKDGVCGFLNATLKAAMAYDTSSLPDYVKCGAPKWFFNAIVKDYGEEEAARILSCPPLYKTHVRPYPNESANDFEKRLTGFTKTELGYYVDKVPQRAIVQGLASMRAVHSYINNANINEKSNVLDACAAPGGKSVYLKQLTNANITACDISDVRCDMIRKYSADCRTPLNIVKADAMVCRADFVKSFDMVIADVPCSGTGDCKSRPDVLLNKDAQTIKRLNGLQIQILRNVANYVKHGGILCYSTCSILKSENDAIVKRFLTKANDFELLPMSDDSDFFRLSVSADCEGFFAARFRRKGE